MSKFQPFIPRDFIGFDANEAAEGDWMNNIMLAYVQGEAVVTYMGGKKAVFVLTPDRDHIFMWGVFEQGFSGWDARDLRRALDQFLEKRQERFVIEVDPRFKAREDLATFLGFSHEEGKLWGRG